MARRGTAGVLLAELLLAITAILIAGVWLLGAYQSSFTLIEASQQTNVAVNDLKDVMERIKTTPFTQLNADFPDGAAADYSAVTGGYTLTGEQITVTHSPNQTADPKELTVQVNWTTRGRAYQRTLSTVRSSEAS
jgi:hypothetical protein